MDSSFLILLTCLITAATYLLLGVLIGFGKKANLINGVDFSQLTSVEDFCKDFGNGLIVSGLFLVFTGSVFYSGGGVELFFVLFVTFCGLPLVYFARAKQKYAKRTPYDKRG